MSASNRYWKIDLSSPPQKVVCFDFDLRPHHESFTQDPERWLMVLYRHSGVVGIGARAYSYTPGALAVIPPGTRVNHDRVGDGTKCNWMEFALHGELGPPISVPLLTQLDDPDWLLREIDGAGVMAGRTGAMIASVIWATLWRIHKPASYYREFVELYEAEKFIQDNLGEPLRVDAVARRVGVSSRTLLRMFRQVHGITVEEYITSQKVEVARRLLANTSQPIKAISARIGVFSYQHFNNLIRGATGLSPNAYRDQAIKVK